MKEIRRRAFSALMGLAAGDAIGWQAMFHRSDFDLYAGVAVQADDSPTPAGDAGPGLLAAAAIELWRGA